MYNISLFFAKQLFADSFVENGQQREDDDAQGYEGEVLLDDRNVAEEVTAAYEEGNPDNSADNIILSKGCVVHFAYACYEGSEGTDNGHETGQEDGFVTMLFVESRGFVNVLRFNELCVHIEQSIAEFFAYHVVAGIT